jgi:hypothetical protein
MFKDAMIGAPMRHAGAACHGKSIRYTSESVNG